MAKMQQDPTLYLKSLLLPDTDKIKKKMETHEDLPIEKYSHILSQIEFSIASCYSENISGLTDKKTLAVLESLLTSLKIKTTLTSDSYEDSGSQITRKSKNTKTTAISRDLKNSICDAAIESLRKRPVTQHEFELCLRFIMYSIDNRSWVPASRGYLDWISNMFGLLPEWKKEEFDVFYGSISQLFGIEMDLLTMDKTIDEALSKKYRQDY